MANIKQTDVASAKPTSGSSIAKAAGDGKILPASAPNHLQPDLPEPRATGIAPHNGKADSADNRERSKAFNEQRKAGLSGDSEQIRSMTIGSAVTALNDFVQQEKRDIEFVVKDEAGVSVVKITNRESGELIRQLPGNEVIDLARKLNDQHQLRLFSAQV